MQRKIYYLYAICIVLALFYSCKKDKTDKDTNSQKTEAQQLADLFNIQDEALIVYANSLKNQHDTLQAILDMGKWLKNQNEVEAVSLIDYNRIVVKCKSGISISINIIQEGLNGEHAVREGGSRHSTGSATTYYLGGKRQNNANKKSIGNNKVLIICPFLEEFYGSSYPYLEKFNESQIPLEVTLVTNNKCTIDLLETFNQYGFIIINTHGSHTGSFLMHTGVDKFDIPEKPDNSKKFWKHEFFEDLLNKNSSDIIQKIKEGKFELEFSGLLSSTGEIRRTVEIAVTGKAVREMASKLADAVVFGNYCYSGQTREGQEILGLITRDIPKSWETAGAQAYYGYAYSDGEVFTVENNFCKQMEERIITRLVQNGDSTGIAHLDDNLSEYSYSQLRRKRIVEEILITDTLKTETVKIKFTTFLDNMICKLFHSPQYAYGCGVFTDPRDGEKYKLACIGDQVWFAENLRYNASGSVVYNNDNSNLGKYGRLYNYTIASAGQGIGSITGQGLQGICPNGWHLPNKQEMEKLMATLSTYGSANDYGKMLKAKVLWQGENAQDLDDSLRNVVGFNALPAGKAIYTEDGRMNYFLEKEDATFWGSSPGPVSPNSTTSVIILNTSIHSTSLGDFTVLPRDYDYLSCRCLQDKE